MAACRTGLVALCEGGSDVNASDFPEAQLSAEELALVLDAMGDQDDDANGAEAQ
jgi:hypothetical protein